MDDSRSSQEVDCARYIIETLGHVEQIPARFNIKEGTDLMLDRLNRKFGMHGRLLYLEL